MQEKKRFLHDKNELCLSLTNEEINESALDHKFATLSLQ